MVAGSSTQTTHVCHATLPLHACHVTHALVQRKGMWLEVHYDPPSERNHQKYSSLWPCCCTCRVEPPFGRGNHITLRRARCQPVVGSVQDENIINSRKRPRDVLVHFVPSGVDAYPRGEERRDLPVPSDRPPLPTKPNLHVCTSHESSVVGSVGCG
jgi:hypothetical protein